MPCQLVSDAHEGMNEVPTVPIHYPAIVGNGLGLGGVEDPVDLDSRLLPGRDLRREE